MAFFGFVLFVFFLAAVLLFIAQLLAIAAADSMQRIFAENDWRVWLSLPFVPKSIAVRLVPFFARSLGVSGALAYAQMYLSRRLDLEASGRDDFIDAIAELSPIKQLQAQSGSDSVGSDLLVKPYTQFLGAPSEMPGPAKTVFLGATLSAEAWSQSQRLLVPISSRPSVDLPTPEESLQMNRISRLALDEILPPELFELRS